MHCAVLSTTLHPRLYGALQGVVRQGSVKKEVKQLQFRERGFSSYVGQRKTSESHEESNLRPSDSAISSSTTERQRVYGERGAHC